MWVIGGGGLSHVAPQNDDFEKPFPYCAVECVNHRFITNKDYMIRGCSCFVRIIPTQLQT